MNSLTTEQLEQELAVRNNKKDAQEKPCPLTNPDFKPVQDICSKYIEALAKDGYAAEDFDHYVYETAMEAVFGKDVWKWINAKLP